jgi:hypothetical protein
MSEGNTTPPSGSVQRAAEPPSEKAVPGGGPLASPKLTGVALWTAIFAIAIWLGFSIFLVAKAGTNDTEWARIAWVFGSIQAVAFAAAGALFGTSVQQQNVSNAQQQAMSAQKDADQQREDATKGRTLAMTLQAEANAPPAGGTAGTRSFGAGAPAGGEGAEELRQRHAQLSRALFGDLSV